MFLSVGITSIVLSRLFPPEYDYIMADPGGGGVNGMASNHIAKSKFVRTFNYGHTKLLKCALLDIHDTHVYTYVKMYTH